MIPNITSGFNSCFRTTPNQQEAIKSCRDPMNSYAIPPSLKETEREPKVDKFINNLLVIKKGNVIWLRINNEKQS